MCGGPLRHAGTNEDRHLHLADATGHRRRWNETGIRPGALCRARIINEEGRARLGEGKAGSLRSLGLGLPAGGAVGQGAEGLSVASGFSGRTQRPGSPGEEGVLPQGTRHRPGRSHSVRSAGKKRQSGLLGHERLPLASSGQVRPSPGPGPWEKQARRGLSLLAATQPARPWAGRS